MNERPDALRVGLLGYGTVGQGAYRMLTENREAITRKVGFPVEIVRIGIRDADKARNLPAEMFTTELDTLIADPSIQVIVEVMGGVEPAGRLVEAAIRAGKSVVTANKELMAKQGSRLVHLAKSAKLDLHYEAAVGGGIPLVQPLKHQLAGNDVLQMMGILNGTTNYILTAMQDTGADFADALADAQRLGYAEADPTNDVDGFDTAYKISILASIAFGKQVPMEAVSRVGIRSVTAADMAYADTLGYRIKLLGVADAVPGPAGETERVRTRVHPALVPKAHPLASVAGVYNALWLHGDFVGDLMFSGRGAGSDPTASAVVGDLIDVGRNLAVGGPGSALPYDDGMATEPMETLRSRHYLRMQVEDRPRVLGQLALLFGEANVSISAMEMRTLGPGRGEIVFLSDIALESDFRAALSGVRRHPSVIELSNAYHVVDATAG
ncbi:MAG: homoserine dehydrogenase [Fimbriimonadaceae bacterium]|nr:homoserine dehydrogenase [Fimbriimonadaceae bacterium]